MTEHATLRENRDICDTRYIRKLMEDCDWNIDKAAPIAGIKRCTLYNLIYRLGIKRQYRPKNALARRRIPLKHMADGAMAMSQGA